MDASLIHHCGNQFRGEITRCKYHCTRDNIVRRRVLCDYPRAQIFLTCTVTSSSLKYLFFLVAFNTVFQVSITPFSFHGVYATTSMPKSVCGSAKQRALQSRLVVIQPSSVCHCLSTLSPNSTPHFVLS